MNRTDWTGLEASFSYDSAGRLVEYVNGAGTTSYAYNEDGNLAQQTNVNGTLETISYDVAGQVVEVKHRKSNGQIFGYLSYSYNVDGLVDNVVEWGWECSDIQL